MALEANIVNIAIPCAGGMIHQGCVQSLLRTVPYCLGAGFRVGFSFLGSESLITRGRNTCIAGFLASDATHLMFIDADIVFEPEDIQHMLEFNEGVVAGLYPIKALDVPFALRTRPLMTEESLEQSAYHYVGSLCARETLERRGDFVTGVWAGCGFMLIKREAILEMQEAYPELQYTQAHIFPPQVPQVRYGLFDTMIDPETKAYLSEDYAFCHRWRALGHKVWLDLAAKLTHVGSHRYEGNPQARFTDLLIDQQSALSKDGMVNA